MDLRHIIESRLQMVALQSDIHLQRGDTVTLLTGQEPSITLHSLNLQLRHRLRWHTDKIDSAQWKTIIHHRDDVAPRDLMDLLSRDHQRLDELFGLSLHWTNAGELDKALPLFAEFAVGLKRHVQVENEILAPRFRVPNTDPVTTMLREHDDILAQMDIIESLCTIDEPGQGWELSPFMGILSGTMAKHESREEQNVFPHWDIALRRAPREDQLALMAQATQVLSPI